MFNPDEITVLGALANGGRLALVSRRNGPGHSGARIEPGGMRIRLDTYDRLIVKRAIRGGVITDVGLAAIRPAAPPARDAAWRSASEAGVRPSDAARP